MFSQILKGALGLSLVFTFSGTPVQVANTASIEVLTCDGNSEGYYEVEIFSDRQVKASIYYVADGTRKRLRGPFKHIREGNGFRVFGPGIDFAYSNGRGTFYDGAFNERFSCRSPRVSSNPNPDRPAQGNINVVALSLGGIIRSGPGRQYQKIGSIYGRATITIVRNTGVRMNGYDWFEIRGPKGRPGYQWGGIMCSPNRYVAGVYERCN